MDKYFNDAIIGNKNLKASYSSKGELLRLFYPNIDYRQFIDFFDVGIKINDSNIIYLHKDINNSYSQYYKEDTNIINTEIVNEYFKVKIIQTDFVCIDDNILVKKYKLINQNNNFRKEAEYYYNNSVFILIILIISFIALCIELFKKYKYNFLKLIL